MNIDIVFHTPEIPGNTGNAIRLAAVTGAHLHLVEPLGFDLSDAKLRRAGLDYHDLAHVTVHPTLADLWDHLGERRVIAFSTHTENSFAEVEYRDGDVLLFGQESTGLPDSVVADDHVDMSVRIPMLPSRRSLNLANSASIAIYEAWRQQGYAGA
ncbi:tRNA (cytidine(34)-2'-O)-methyltransferase [Brevibacterium sp. ZH18]|uniref:tRNA (cytidine(34)-2'-O)-methyltransferase n=1 Tax=Brevibacterium sp. ZH18 TaxID=2927784 RepID=UPI001F61A009|nr:tRNA (cytidine(34)-2'-O)-methyltransferase [Brevibacterium sp. ZH18]MCI4010510.1 tRNA (cytidine(34)-2'-O)-methyltransferase [Brevibacterium sp. ZH18]